MGIQLENLLGPIGKNDIARRSAVVAGDNYALGAMESEDSRRFQRDRATRAGRDGRRPVFVRQRHKVAGQLPVRCRYRRAWSGSTRRMRLSSSSVFGFSTLGAAGPPPPPPPGAGIGG